MELIISHVSADFDGLASMVAAQKLYPRAKLCFTGTPEQAVKDFMNLYKDFINVENIRHPEKADIKRLIIVDCRNPNRLGNFRDIVNNPQVEVHIYDHHPPTIECIKGDVNVIEEVGATVTILMKKIIEKNIYLSPLEATLMAVGIYEETGSLLFTTTTADDARVVSHLLTRGVKLEVVADFVHHYLNEEQRKILNDLIISSYVLRIKGFKILIARDKLDHYVDGLALVTHRLKDLERMDCVISVVQMSDRIYIVARSIRPAINVERILKFFGGGGHSTAASAVMKNISLSDVERRLKTALKNTIEPQIRASDIMTSPVQTLEITEGMTLNEAFEYMRKIGRFNLPITKDGKLVGLVDRKDLDKARIHNYGNAPLQIYMSTPVMTSTPDASIFQLQDILMEKGIGCLPILDRGKMVGIVTRQDVLEAVHNRDLKSYRKEDRTIDRVKKLPKYIRDLLKVCGHVGDGLKMSVYVVGGFVRDLIMGAENLDIDIVVEGDGMLYGEQLARKLDGRVKIHEKFGTAVVVLPDGIHIDVASSRTEYYTRPAALPEVMMSSIKQDLYRRDFTINALAIRLNRRYFGELLDFFGCRKDIRNGVIRVLHPMSFIDDPTRILRAVKFEQRYQFRMDPSTVNLLKDALSQDIFNVVSAERLRNEFIEILEESRPLPAVKRMEELRILRLMNKNIHLDSRMVEAFEAVAGLLVQFNDLINREGAKVWIIYFSILVMRLEPDEILDIATRFRVPNNIISRASFDKEKIHEVIRTICSRSLKTSELFRNLEHLSLETMIFMMARVRMAGVGNRVARFLNELRYIKPLITGKELMEWGIEPGPSYKDILTHLFNAQLDDKFSTVEGAKDFLDSRLKFLL